MNLDIKALQNVEIPPLDSTVHEALALLCNAEVDGRVLANAISHDTGLIQNLFKVANSAYFSQGKPTSDVTTAISRIGFSWVRQVLVSHALKSSFSFKSNRIFDGNIFRRHSSFVAFVAQDLARKRCPDLMHDLFLAGMFHDVGLAALATFLPAEFEILVSECLRTEVSFSEAEEKLKRDSHRDVGSAIVAQWNFPESVCKLIETHDLPFNITSSKIDEKLHVPAEILAIADKLAHRFGAGYNTYHHDNFISPFSLKRVKLTPEDLMGSVALCNEFAGSMFS
jgi:HD-like signal output (HDOD) protein